MNIFEDFRTYEFVDNNTDKYIVEAIYNHSKLYDLNKGMLHTKILTYMVSKNERDISRYLHYLKNSKPIKEMQLDCEEIAKAVIKDLQETRKAINEISKM